MISCKLSEWRAVPGLASNPAWTRALEWLENEAPAAADGVYNLGAEGFTARVMAYAHKSRERAVLESHRHTIDLHYTLSGAEAVEFDMAERLTKTEYKEANEADYYEKPCSCPTSVADLPGIVTIILPGEVHMSGLAVPGYLEVRKVVIKLPARLL
ncbi:MAG TPA: YhcH/YjgK/YiaL family protein [Opitutales bacterium]|nr:YhcH/YjgK/YiaL family protein [Opitutales bacterium]